jgi:hypothetical protein
MRTLLTQFCEQFEAISRPLLEPLTQAVDALSVAPFDLPARRILPGLRDVRQQFDSLVDKVAGQHSYVLIFGPLKSGKSTLMNAVAAAYVSEVTCLPAYPCMVYVTHKDSRELKVTRYDGQSSYYTDPTALRKALARAHSELAEKIRARGDGEETFDPAVHFPEAIRRVDVGLPAGQLGRSGAVMVDTPGLYARMRFGYDRMTREFRNSAACAVFVVKTDNLFLEQVFEEFGRLLDLFSRVFLVVNLDSTKRDLLPDGTLSPSLEKDDPSKVIETFERLSMDAPLRQAYLEGKLKIYPVDLLRAANYRLLAAAAEAGANTAGKADAGKADAGKSDAPSPEASRSKTADFDKFRDDLTTYLNSNEYLRSFLGDSLKHADALLRETGLLCDMGPVRDMTSRVSTLRIDRETAKKTVTRVTTAQALDWKAAFAGLRTRIADGTKGRCKEIRDKTADAVGGVLERWFQSDKGLPALADDTGALFASSLKEAGPVVSGSLKDCVAAGSAGARIPFEVTQTLADLDVSLEGIARTALDKVNPLAGLSVQKPTIDIDAMPVRRSFLDWLFFHSPSRIRRELFGTIEAPNTSIPVAAKAKRLGSASREAMRTTLLAHLDGFFSRAVDGMVDRSLETYAPAVIAGVSPEIAARKQEAEETFSDAERRLAEVANVVDSLTRLRRAMDYGVTAVDTLTKRHAETDPALLNRPIESATEPDDRDTTSKGRRSA